MGCVGYSDGVYREVYNKLFFLFLSSSSPARSASSAKQPILYTLFPDPDMVHISKIAALVAACVAPSFAHPGEKHDHHQVEREISAREHWAHEAKRSLDSSCTSAKARRFAAKTIERRAAKAQELRAKRGITSRMHIDIETALRR
jgi:hypothetical protein